MRKLSFNNYKIRTKLLLIYCFCVLLPIIFTDAIIMYTVNRNYQEDRNKDLRYAMERIKSNLQDTVEGSILFTHNLFSNEMLDEFLSKQYINQLDYYENYKRMLKNNTLSYNYNYGLLYKIIIFADNDTLVNGGSIARLDTAKNEDWYKAFQESGQDIFLFTYYDDARRIIPGSGTSRTISIIRKLNHFKKQGMEKVLKIDIDYNYLQKDVLNEKIDGEIYVRNKDYILLSNLPSSSGVRQYETAESLKEDPKMSLIFQNGYQEWEILIFANEAPFWSVIFENKQLIVLVLINVFVPTILIYIVGVSISRRLSLISIYMGKVEQEQFEVINIKEGDDEIGKLIRSYNLMVTKIKDLIEVVFKGNAEKQALELAKKQAELKALQSQVNPHFLFNTLETIRMRSLIKKETETAFVIGELAVLFRKSMSWEAGYITIEEEMGFVDNYIHIQRYRFGDKLRYYHYVMEECKGYFIPKLSIGTFIENAFIHGIETTVKEGVISVTVTKTFENLIIEISDNGNGIEKQKLMELKELFEHANSSMLNETQSTGMLNSFLRLKLYCDGNVVLDIDSEPDKGTDITIKLPLKYIQQVKEEKHYD